MHAQSMIVSLSDFDIHKTGNLHGQLKICEEPKATLTHNMNLAGRLINGSPGTIITVQYFTCKCLVLEILFMSQYIVGNKAKGPISKRVFQENRARQIFRKTNIFYPLIRTRTRLALLPYYRRYVKFDLCRGWEIQKKSSLCLEELKHCVAIIAAVKSFRIFIILPLLFKEHNFLENLLLLLTK